jgi:hypothetical protein
LALLVSAASCSPTLDRLADTQGRLEAGVQLAPWPAHCRQPVPHADVALGANPVSTLKRERTQLDFANERAANCGAWYDRQKTAYEAAQL